MKSWITLISQFSVKPYLRHHMNIFYNSMENDRKVLKFTQEALLTLTDDTTQFKTNRLVRARKVRTVYLIMWKCWELKTLIALSRRNVAYFLFLLLIFVLSAFKGYFTDVTIEEYFRSHFKETENDFFMDEIISWKRQTETQQCCHPVGSWLPSPPTSQ